MSISREFQRKVLLLNSICDIAHHAGLNVFKDIKESSYEIDVKAASKEVENSMLSAFRACVEIESTIRAAIQSVPITTSKEDKTIFSESEIIETLILADITKIVPFMQVYWMYTVWTMINRLSDAEAKTKMKKFEFKLKKLNLPEKYGNLLKVSELPSMSREMFLSALLSIEP